MSSRASDTQQTKSGSYLMSALGFIFIFLIVLLILATCTETGRKYADGFKDKLFPDKQKLKDLAVVMFMIPSCPHCVRTLDVLEKEKELNNITIIDVTKEEGKKIAEQFGADKKPVPSFISRKTNRSAIGSIENVSQLVKALSGKYEQISSEEGLEESSEEQSLGSDDINLVQQLNIILFARDGCGWCVKAKEECNKAGILHAIKVIDVSTEEGQKAASDLLPRESTGVPAWVSLKTRKVAIGYKPVPILLKELQ